MVGNGMARVATVVVAALGALVFAAGCSSDTGGKGSPAFTIAASDGSGGSGGATAPISVPPVSGIPSTIPSIPAGGGGASSTAFCKDWAGIGEPDVSSSAGLSDLVSKIEKAAADAPAALKDDMNTLLQVFKGLADHSLDVSKLPTTYAPAVERVVTYVATNCH